MADDKAPRRSESPSESKRTRTQEKKPNKRREDPEMTAFKAMMLPMLDGWCERARKEVEDLPNSTKFGEQKPTTMVITKGPTPKLREDGKVIPSMLALNQQIRTRNSGLTMANLDAPIEPLVDICTGEPIPGFPTRLRQIEELSYEEARRILSALDSHTASTGDFWTIRENLRRWTS